MYDEEANRSDKRQKRPDDEPQAYAGADENSSSDDDEDDTYGDENDNNLRNSSSYSDIIIGLDGLPMHNSYPKDKGNRKRIPAPMWLQAGGPKRHSDVQLQSGENLTNLKRKYKQSLCLYCAEFNKKSPWATTRSRKYEHEIFNKHEKSKHHQQALSELNKSSYGMVENNSEAAVYTEEFVNNNNNNNIDNCHNNNDIIHSNNSRSNNRIHNNNNNHINHTASNNGSNIKQIDINLNNNINNLTNTNTDPQIKSRFSDQNNNSNNNNNSSSSGIVTQSSSIPFNLKSDGPAREHALMLAAISSGCNPILRIPGSIPSSNSHTNLASSYTKKNKTVRPFQEVYPPYGLCENNYNNSHNQHLHDYDHESYNGGAMLRTNESNNNLSNINNISNNDNNNNNDNHNNNNGNNVNDNNNNSSSGSNNFNNNNQNGQNVQNGNNAFPNPNIYQTFNSFYDDVHATSIDENGNKILLKNDLNYSRISDDKINDVNKLKNVDKNNIFESESPSNFSNPTGIKKFKPISKPAITPPEWNQVCGEMIHSDALLSSGRTLDGVPRRHRRQCCMLCAEFSPRSPWASMKSRKYDWDTWHEHTNSLSHTTALAARDALLLSGNINEKESDVGG